MRTDLFEFELPEHLIALEPANPREAARLLQVRPAAEPNGSTGAQLSDHIVSDLPGLLRAGDVLVYNDTRVIPAALRAKRRRGEAVARIGVNLIKRLDADRWRALARPAKRLAVGDQLQFASPQNDRGLNLTAEVVAKDQGGEVTLRFSQAGPALDRAIREVGEVPLPPYIAQRRAGHAGDSVAYQTVYACRDGAVAAPTAGLHFTPELLQRLSAHGIAQQRLTLHVGAGTFLPVKVADTRDHRMHAEWGEIDAQTASALNTARARGGRIVAVGTTTLRLLESAADTSNIVHPFRGETSIFITPGYRFRAVDGLLTNFHLPRSTLFMLVCAFAGVEPMLQAYRHAIATGYRFYSYGDACLLMRA